MPKHGRPHCKILSTDDIEPHKSVFGLPNLFPKAAEDPFHQSSRTRDDYLYNTPLHTPFGTVYSQPQRVKIIAGKHVTRADEPFVPSAREPDAPSPTHQRAGPATDRNGINPHSVLPAINCARDSDVPTDLGDIYDRLPRDCTLCQEPLLLNKAEEAVIVRELQRQLKFLSPEAIRSAYQDLMRIDHSNSGYIAFQDLKVILSKNTIRLPLQLIRLLCCAHVSRIEIGRVCYSKILSFILSAIESREGQDPVMPKPKPQAEDAMPVVREQRPEVPSVPSPSHPPAPSVAPEPLPHDFARPLRSVRQEEPPSPRRSPLTVADTQRSLQQVACQLPSDLNLEALRNAFGRADRTRRGTLSELQIREICGEILRIGKETVDRLLQHVPLRSGAQYNWEAIVDLLERIQPVSTGLFIPPSKRPLDYARIYRQPASSWPAAESPTFPPESSQDPMTVRSGLMVSLHQADANQQASQQDAGVYYLPQPSDREGGPQGGMRTEAAPPMDPAFVLPPPQDLHLPLQHQEPPHPPSPPLQNCHPPPPINYRETNGHSNLAEAPLPEANEMFSEPWHSRFMRLAQHLYNQDRHSTGLLAEDKTLHFTQDCNSIYRLNLYEEQIIDALSRNRQGSEVNLHGYLMRLAMTH